MEDKWYELTDSYLRGEMSEQEKNRFHQLLDEDPAFKDFFELEKNIIAGILSAPKKKREGLEKMEIIQAVDRQMRSKSRKRELVRWAAIAACITFLVTAGAAVLLNASKAGNNQENAYNYIGDNIDILDLTSIPVYIKIEGKTINTGSKIAIKRENFEAKEGNLYQYTSPVLKIYSTDTSLLKTENLYWETQIKDNQFFHYLKINTQTYLIEENESEQPLKPVRMNM